MRLPLWKKWLSYLYPIPIERLSSSKNPQLTVVLDRGRLQLLSGNAIYSWDDLYHNFTTTFAQLNIKNRDTADVLILGLGLGSIPYILETVYHRQYRYIAVEWDEAVAHLATKYTLPRLKSRVDIIISDAEYFVCATRAQFDLIAVDIFEDDRTPAIFESVDFLRACRQRLNPEGLILYNRLYNSDINRKDSLTFYREVFCRVFDKDFDH